MSPQLRDSRDGAADCPRCRQPIDLRLDAAGVEINDLPCPHCGHEIHIVPALPRDTGVPEADELSTPC